MKKYSYEELKNMSIDELKIIKSDAYDDFVETLSKLPLDVREAFNYYMNLSKTIDIILNNRIKEDDCSIKFRQIKKIQIYYLDFLF